MKCALLHILYSPDKLLIAVTGTGNICIFDDLTTEDTVKDSLVREVHASDNEVIALAYSHTMGLIATADNNGVIIIWSFQYLSVEMTLLDILPPGVEINKMCFLEPYPFLLLADR